MSTAPAAGGLPVVSVVVPTYDQAAFLPLALRSLQGQRERNWEAVVVDDGSPDATAEVVRPFLEADRITYHHLPENRGLGAALNVGLDLLRGDLVAYLPSDDVWFPDHLSSLLGRLATSPEAVATFAGVRYRAKRAELVGNEDREAEGRIEGRPLQLVQVLHRRSAARWVERTELVTDDLERMLWGKLRAEGAFVGTATVTCEWGDHPDQRSKWIRAETGGLNAYRYRYRVSHPLRFHPSDKDLVDEESLYRRFLGRPDTPPAPDGLKIVLVGELAYNPERVLALEERGHRLYGLWTPDAWWFNTVGPLPFGHVEDLPRQSWQEAVRGLRPDVIYAQLNWQAVPFVHSVLEANPGVPFVWHFKEGPFACREKGTWPRLADLCTRADGVVHINPETQAWFDLALPGGTDPEATMVLDGDLPKRDWFAGARRPLLSERDGEPHTVCPGRPMGLTPQALGELAAVGVHVHLYGSLVPSDWDPWAAAAKEAAGRFVHFHAAVDQSAWVAEFSQYDAGWLHLVRSRNGGDLTRATWADLNYPARLATILAAGVPLLQPDQGDALVAVDNLARSLDVGVVFTDFEHLRAQLGDRALMGRLRDNAWRRREEASFDHHADRLVDFFRRTAARAR